ncbi:unnamed protein product [Vitrella brassicaformis CCMP3155]|uniref:DNA polymerase alpha subunit B n=2 Tax=Vitrella brassicaformis TaxID=1169539 RepID=A0A0G4F6V7_VITBC|nr:unnamed protein product [Vitrella brassicaformis CCMP3155]|eukprot:CEM07858.1 unnamed protein product [Vitrella brassicaformis CCMP3155]
MQKALSTTQIQTLWTEFDRIARQAGLSRESFVKGFKTQSKGKDVTQENLEAFKQYVRQHRNDGRRGRYNVSKPADQQRQQPQHQQLDRNDNGGTRPANQQQEKPRAKTSPGGEREGSGGGGGGVSGSPPVNGARSRAANRGGAKTPQQRPPQQQHRKGSGPPAAAAAAAASGGGSSGAAAAAAAAASSSPAPSPVVDLSTAGVGIFSPLAARRGAPLPHKQPKKPDHQQQGSRATVYSLNSDKLDGLEGRMTPYDQQRLKITVLPSIEQYEDHDGVGFGCRCPYAYKWMAADARTRSKTTDERVHMMCKALKDHLEDDSETADTFDAAQVGDTRQSDVWVFGRIVADSESGPLNAASCLLEGDRHYSNGDRVELKIADDVRCVLFPGQVVAAWGMGERVGSGIGRFTAKKIVCGLPSPSPTLPLQTLRRSSDETYGGKPLHIAVATGPFVLPGTLDYTPLDRLLAQLSMSRPRLLVLMGPFVDARNEQVAAGALVEKREPDEDNVDMTRDDDQLTSYLCYEEVYRRVFEKIDAFRRGEENVSPIQVAIMPSLHDVGQCYPLPQPAFDLASFREALDVSHFPLEEDTQQMDTGSTPKVLWLSNPCRMMLGNELEIAMTSCDIIGPIMGRRFMKGEGSSFDRCFEAFLGQRSFFPLDPPYHGQQHSHQIEFGQVHSMQFDMAGVAKNPPHMFIFASSHISPFARVAQERVFVNTGLYDGTKPFVCTDIFIYPPILDTQDGEGDAAMMDESATVRVRLPERVRVDITRVDMAE